MEKVSILKSKDVSNQNDEPMLPNGPLFKVIVSLNEDLSVSTQAYYGKLIDGKNALPISKMEDYNFNSQKEAEKCFDELTERFTNLTLVNLLKSFDLTTMYLNDFSINEKDHIALFRNIGKYDQNLVETTSVPHTRSKVDLSQPSCSGHFYF